MEEESLGEPGNEVAWFRSSGEQGLPPGIKAASTPGGMQMHWYSLSSTECLGIQLNGSIQFRGSLKRVG